MKQASISCVRCRRFAPASLRVCSSAVEYMVLSLFLLGSAQGADLLDRLQPRGFVNDFANVIPASDEQALVSVISEVRKKTGAEIAVVTLQSLEGNGIDDFSNRLFEKWGIGQKGKDNGVLFLAAMKERKMRIEVGYGLEGAIPDAQAGRIRRDVITPYFKAGRPGKGIVAGVAALSREISGETRGDPVVSGSSSKPGLSGSIIARIAVLFGMFAIVAAIARLGGAIKGDGRRKRGTFSPKDRFHGGYGGYSGGGGFGGSGGGGFGGGCSGGGGSSGGW